MTAHQNQEAILEEKRRLCAARRKALSTVRMSQSQTEQIADDALSDQLAGIQEKIGVVTGDFASQFFSNDKQRNELIRYINGEKDNTLRDLLEPVTAEQEAENWHMLNRLVLMHLKSEPDSDPIALVGHCSDVIEAAFAHHRIEFEGDDESTMVWTRDEDNSTKPIYALRWKNQQGNAWAPKARVLLLESAIIHASAEEGRVIWEQLKDKAPESRALAEFLLESQSDFVEHNLAQHVDGLSNQGGMAGDTSCYVNLNPLQAMMSRIQAAIIDDLARLESVPTSQLPYVEDRNGAKTIRFERLSCHQKVHAIQCALDSGNLTLVGNAEKLIKAETAGDGNTFLFVAAQNAQKLSSPPVVPEQFASSQPTVHLDW